MSNSINSLDIYDIFFKVDQKVQFLSNLDPDQFSVSTKDDELIAIHKRSAIRNFFGWVVYLLSFTLIPRNHNLRSHHPENFQELEAELDAATDSEKNLAEKAVRNLGMIIENNGGSEGKNVVALLKTIAKIQTLPAVKRLSGEEMAVEDSPVLSEKRDSPKKLFVEKKGPEEPPVDPETQGHKGVQEDEDEILETSRKKKRLPRIMVTSLTIAPRGRKSTGFSPGISIHGGS